MTLKNEGQNSSSSDPKVIVVKQEANSQDKEDTTAKAKELSQKQLLINIIIPTCMLTA